LVNLPNFFFILGSYKKKFLYATNVNNVEVSWRLDKPTKIVAMGMIVGLILFIGFYTMSVIHYAPLGNAFNNFFTMVGIILFFIAGFFYASLKTVNRQKN
jgi:hypothetical protein